MNSHDRSFLFNSKLISKNLHKIGSYPYSFQLSYKHVFEKGKMKMLYNVRMEEKDINYISNLEEKLLSIGFQVIILERNINDMFIDILMIYEVKNVILRSFLKYQYICGDLYNLNSQSSYVYNAFDHRIEYLSNFF